MAFYDMATGKRLFGILFLIAAVIFIILLLIKGNTVFGTSLKVKGNTLYLKKWDNSFLPYNADSGLFSDLMPAKTKTVLVDVDDITSIFIGTKEFIKRNLTESGKRFIKALYPYEHSSKKSKQTMVAGLDMFYLETKDGDCAFMWPRPSNRKRRTRLIKDEREWEKIKRRWKASCPERCSWLHELRGWGLLPCSTGCRYGREDRPE